MWTRMGLGLSEVAASRRFRRLDGRQHSPVELAEQAPELVHFGAAEVAQRQIEFLHDQRDETLDGVAAQGQLQLYFASIAAHALQESPLRRLVDDAGRRAAFVTIFS